MRRNICASTIIDARSGSRFGAIAFASIPVDLAPPGAPANGSVRAPIGCAGPPSPHPASGPSSPGRPPQIPLPTPSDSPSPPKTRFEAPHVTISRFTKPLRSPLRHESTSPEVASKRGTSRFALRKIRFEGGYVTIFHFRKSLRSDLFGRRLLKSRFEAPHVTIFRLAKPLRSPLRQKSAFSQSRFEGGYVTICAPENPLRRGVRLETTAGDVASKLRNGHLSPRSHALFSDSAGFRANSSR